jgi:hypothetical protein
MLLPFRHIHVLLRLEQGAAVARIEAVAPPGKQKSQQALACWLSYCFGSPTWARTRDLRINSLPVKGYREGFVPHVAAALGGDLGTGFDQHRLDPQRHDLRRFAFC